MKPMEGNVFKFGDHINTDLIIPTAHLSGDNKEMGKYCMKDLDPTFAKNARQGDIVVAGVNFGCGSTKSGAGALLGAGIVCVVAKSFGRIFFRNAINAGLLVIESEAFVNATEAGQRARIDFESGLLTNLTTGQTFQMPVYPELIRDIIASGGIIELVKKQGLKGII